jgi:hypothetical protein
MLWLRAGAASTGALLLVASSIAAARGDDATAIVAAACSHDQALQNYTFHASVEMTMRHFPWLHFRMQGSGRYDRSGARYVIHFTSMPWFASGMHDIDLSMIDPNLWSRRYTYRAVGEQGHDTLFSLHELSGDDVRNATVALNPRTGVDWVDATYRDGTRVHMTIGKSLVDGFLLPVALSASVDYSRMPLTASANFTDYALSTN